MLQLATYEMFVWRMVMLLMFTSFSRNRKQREPRNKNYQPNVPQPRNNVFVEAGNNSFTAVLKTGTTNPNLAVESALAIVLDDSCLLERDFSFSLVGKIKDINALSNLYFILANEGFENLKLSYIGGQWVLIEMDSIASKEKISKHFGVGSWFYELKPASNSFVSDDRIKVIVKGQVYWIHVKEIKPWSPEFIIENEESSSDDESERQEEVQKSGNYANDFEPGNENDIDHLSESSSEKNLDKLSQPKNGLLDANVGVSTDKSGSYNFPKLKAGGSILEVMDELIKGNFSFDYVFSPAMGYSGGILCAWDPTLFVKDSSTDLTERRMLWDYISHLIKSWDGECVLFGDFNEVCFKHERHGLIDLPIEVYSYTWYHKSAFKISKLDSFLISKGLLSLFPSILALGLDRHLSDHRPILMRELKVDYGPTMFCLFHSWFEKKGFDDMVEDSWKNSALMEQNSRSNDEIVNERSKLLKDFLEFNSSTSLDLAQKAKIRWAIEGDENSKLVEGNWILKDLERNVSYDEIKRAVWDCGINKSPGPDGFTFGFFRRYWKLIDQDVVDAILLFFSSSSFPRGCNSSFFALIPKTQDAKLVKYFRPISWISSMYKFITKILAIYRLSLVISDLVDDVVFVGKWDMSNLSAIIKVLKWFIGCSTLSALFTYLGVKVGGFMSRLSSWDDVIANLTSRLSKWNLKTLFIGGRLTFIKSALSSLSLYHMSIFKVPMSILNKMKATRRNFFNGVEISDRRLSLISWKKILAFKKNGGLGVSSFFALNRALLFK
ncbi:RNA-directed DNA polymerase, eukaryota [Tanacetum coccineum]|uniref:RNA-directed DNA polymerase, eukaryota n=1 Tax=Tanacetum coccineum TaxID=301880 RepID=A0ABQ4XAZ8_9ASTR